MKKSGLKKEKGKNGVGQKESFLDRYGLFVVRLVTRATAALTKIEVISRRQEASTDPDE